jgi:hypothetical protein
MAYSMQRTGISAVISRRLRLTSIVVPVHVVGRRRVSPEESSSHDSLIQSREAFEKQSIRFESWLMGASCRSDENTYTTMSMESPSPWAAKALVRLGRNLHERM